MPQKHKVTVPDSTLRVKMNNLEEQADNAKARELFWKPLPWLGDIRPASANDAFDPALWETFVSTTLGLAASRRTGMSDCRRSTATASRTLAHGRHARTRERMSERSIAREGGQERMSERAIAREGGQEGVRDGGESTRACALSRALARTRESTCLSASSLTWRPASRRERARTHDRAHSPSGRPLVAPE
jgi:hypothetical protein